MVERIQNILRLAEAQDPDAYGPTARALSDTFEQLKEEGLLPAQVGAANLHSELAQSRIFTNPHFTYEHGAFKITRKGEDFFRTISTTEARLLFVFVNNPNKVIPKEALLQVVLNDIFVEKWDSNLLDVHIRRLRARIGYDGKDYIPNTNSSTPLRTVRGVGYQLIDESLNDEMD